MAARAGGFAGEHLETRLGIPPESVDGFGDVAVQAQRCALGQVIEQRCRLFEKQRQPVFDAGRGDAVGDFLVDRATRRIALEDLAEALAEAGAAFFVEREFARWQQADFRYRMKRALGVDVEGLDAFDFVVEQIQTEGQGSTHRKEVDQAAANRIFAWRDHLRDVGVTGQCQLGAELFRIKPLVLLEEEGIGGQPVRRGEAINGSRGRNQQEVALAAGDAVERRQPFGNEVVVRRKAVIGQGFPVRQQPHTQAGVEPGDFVEQPPRIPGTGRDHCQQTAGRRLPGQLRQVKRIARTGKIRQLAASAGERFGEVGQQGRGGGRREGHGKRQGGERRRLYRRELRGKGGKTGEAHPSPFTLPPSLASAGHSCDCPAHLLFCQILYINTVSNRRWCRG